ncbi:MAG: hypothetical protein N5P05_001226 [Chroococcopsis gigantea SAG 12.99]|nr:hypothetical protein [Chroococcopsis gigantea SAG 12.99]
MENISTFAGSALVKIGGFLLLWLILWIPIAFFLGGKLNWKLGQPATTAQKIPLVVTLYLLAPLPVWALGRLENTSIKDYGGFESGSLLQGIAIGLTGIVVVYGLESLLGWVQWCGSRWSQLLKGIIPLGILTLGLAGAEEFIFRGIFFSQLLDDYGVIGGAIISSMIFALLHLLWERRETLTQLPRLWLMGIILVVAVGADGGNWGLAGDYTGAGYGDWRCWIVRE